MSEVALGIASIACIFGSGAILAKLCSLRNEEIRDVAPEYLLIRKDYYDDLKKDASINKQPVLPPYTAIPLAGNSACSRGYE